MRLNRMRLSWILVASTLSLSLLPTAARLQRPEARPRARLSVARGVLARGSGRNAPSRRFGVERRNRAGIVNPPVRNVPQN